MFAQSLVCLFSNHRLCDFKFQVSSKIPTWFISFAVFGTDVLDLYPPMFGFVMCLINKISDDKKKINLVGKALKGNGRLFQTKLQYSTNMAVDKNTISTRKLVSGDLVPRNNPKVLCPHLDCHTSSYGHRSLHSEMEPTNGRLLCLVHGAMWKLENIFSSAALLLRKSGRV